MTSPASRWTGGTIGGQDGQGRSFIFWYSSGRLSTVIDGPGGFQPPPGLWDRVPRSATSKLPERMRLDGARNRGRGEEIASLQSGLAAGPSDSREEPAPWVGSGLRAYSSATAGRSGRNKKRLARSQYPLQALWITLEAAARFELANNGFAGRCLTTWLCRQKKWSGKRDLNPRLRPWQGRTLPLSYSRSAKIRFINV